MMFLDPKSDIAFKKLFGNNQKKNILISFLNSVLERKDGEKIVSVEILDPNNYPDIVLLKHSIVDVKCTDEKNKNYIVEMQVSNLNDYSERCQYYTSLAFSRQLQKGEDYCQLKPVIFVGIVCFNLFESSDYLSHHLIMNSKTYEHTLKHLEFHFIELNKFNKQLSDLDDNVVDKWTYLLKNAIDMNTVPKNLADPKEIKEAFEVLNQCNWTRKELEAYDEYLDRLRVARSQQKTLQEESKAAGLAEGKAEGEKKTKTKIAKNMLDKFDTKIISEITGLSLKEIEDLKK
ncbi:Rpn family recombination-promoting nuclease/putative transposase [Candidatus Babeliales bacterium]|nr:Rpn family recombination-promoting nuclease/putative transposase [Candidatus Babeliales bacterium]MCF7899259.1 Rpn family recombination-promoting nuclease/putative transposase [Candidatus Babeliales bacterium]